MRASTVVMLVALVVCAGGAGLAAGQDAPVNGKMPKPHEYSYSWDAIYHGFVRPVTRATDVPLLGRKLTGQLREAANVDENDEVRLPSTWWQPRVGYREVTVDQMIKGPGPRTGPQGRWTVSKLKDQGVTPGFQMKDAKGDLYFVKFDLPSNPELTTSLDVMGSLLYWAAGFNVPQNTIAFFHPDSLAFDEEASYTDKSGHKRPLTRDVLGEMLAKVYRQADGRFRVVASQLHVERHREVALAVFESRVVETVSESRDLETGRGVDCSAGRRRGVAGLRKRS